MTAVTLFHNPRCSKSRAALDLLERSGAELRVVEYLKRPPSADELERMLTSLGMRAHDLVRRNEPAYREAGLGPDSDDDDVIAAMVAHPILIERPVAVTDDGRAVVGRPPERVLELL